MIITIVIQASSSAAPSVYVCVYMYVCIYIYMYYTIQIYYVKYLYCITQYTHIYICTYVGQGLGEAAAASVLDAPRLAGPVLYFTVLYFAVLYCTRLD